MRFSLRLNNDLPVSSYRELAQRAEAHGFDQFWVSNDLFLRSAGVILTAVALDTRRIQVGACVLNPYTMNPAEIAMLAATLDEISDGRFLLGIAAGAAEFLGWVGIQHGKPLSAVRESVAAIRRLLSDQSAESDGSFLAWSEEAYLRFPARQAERNIPIYIGGMGARMLALAGEIGDGVLPLLFPPERYYTARAQVAAGNRLSDGKAYLTPHPSQDDTPAQDPPEHNLEVPDEWDEQGKPNKLDKREESFDFAACIWVSASEDRAAARRVLAQKVAYYGSAMNETILADMGLDIADFDPITAALITDRDEAKAIDMVTDDMLRIGVVGSAADIIERLEPLVADGATHLSFGPPLGPDLPEAIDILSKVVNHFKRQKP